MELSSEAQQLLGAMDEAAQNHAQKAGRGYSMIHEDRIGGLGPNEPLPASYTNDDTGAQRYADDLAKFEAHPKRKAIAELISAGLDIAVSAGGESRMIQARGRMFSRA